MGSLKASNLNFKVAWPQGHRVRIMCTVCPFVFEDIFLPSVCLASAKKQLGLLEIIRVLGKPCGKLRELLGLQPGEGISWSTLGISTSAGGWPVKSQPQRLWSVQETESEITAVLTHPVGTQKITFG